MVRERRDSEQRPSPEALLEAARREESASGKLKIFVGAAPGVGKTYEMLQSAHAKRKAGIDVVVGFVETHGRAETEALVRGLEVVPRKRLEYRGQIVEEMDLDAVIARRPKIPKCHYAIDVKTYAAADVEKLAASRAKKRARVQEPEPTQEPEHEQEPEEPEECPVRLDPLTGATATLVCGHLFCEACIADWARSQTTCPTCRATLPRRSPRR